LEEVEANRRRVLRQKDERRRLLAEPEKLDEAQRRKLESYNRLSEQDKQLADYWAIQGVVKAVVPAVKPASLSQRKADSKKRKRILRQERRRRLAAQDEQRESVNTSLDSGDKASRTLSRNFKSTAASRKLEQVRDKRFRRSLRGEKKPVRKLRSRRLKGRKSGGKSQARRVRAKRGHLRV
jgi:hypothetical protein